MYLFFLSLFSCFNKVIMSITCHVYDKMTIKTFLLHIQIHIVQTPVNKYDITWWIIKIQYTGKFDMLTYFFGTNSVVVLSPDCTIFITSFVWRGRGSNPRPPAHGADALTTEPPLRLCLKLLKLRISSDSTVW